MAKCFCELAITMLRIFFLPLPFPRSVRISYNVDVVRSSIAMYLSIFYHASNIANIHIKQYCIGNRIYEQSNDF